MDAVITYVDITERFKKDYNIYCKKSLQLNRFRSYGVLDLQIKLIRKYMSYIKNIFVIVSHKEQVEGIDLSDAKVITHDQIIPASYLPCFNSCTIEMFMWKIPDLSEEFVYFNDDMFVINHIHHTKWFVKGKPCLNPSINKVNKNEVNAYKNNCVNSTKLISSLLNSDKYNGTYLIQAHAPKPYLKSTCETVFNKKIIEIQRSLTRTRHSKNYNCYVFNNYDYISGNYYHIENNYTYINNDSLDIIIEKIINKHESLICINDNDSYIDFDEFKTELRKVLEANLLNNSYEVKQQEVNNDIVILNTSCANTVLCAVGKNENLYIREWVEWYKNLGISKIFLYDNNEINGEHFEDVIGDYIESEYVILINTYRGKSKIQLDAYIDFYNNYSKYYNWCCFFDIDEFLVLTKDNNINEYLQRDCFNEFESIAINWKSYGDNGLLGNENNYDRSCLNRFTKELIHPTGKYDNDIFKKIIRGGLRQISKLESPHTFSPSLDKLVCNNYGEKINGKRFKCQCNHTLAYLKHFCTKTILEYILKAKRGGGVNGLTNHYTNINNFFLYNDKTQEKEMIIDSYFNKDDKIINLLVVNYNTPKLIDILIKNIRLQVKSKYHLYIFDNSDKYECYKVNDENITVFDNTKGQIINFSIWLGQFPGRLDCWAKNNGWGSAKHCYSVEKCFDLINDNFILLDSDILIKKDISELYRDDLFYVGEISQLKTQKLPRISPYLCFINVNLCKLYNIHYFYPNYMHGLSKDAHNYDTGGAFYKFVNKYQHLNIVCDDYITHFGQGSWTTSINKTIYKKEITIDDWLKTYAYLYDEKEILKKQILEFSEKHYPKLKLNLDNPITIQDKINWLKVYDSTELKTKCADKILVHEYCKEKLGKDFCIPILKVYNNTDEINFDELPNKFVIKCNHGSGMNIIVKDKSKLNINETLNKLNIWLNKDFSTSWGYEPHYKDIKRKIFIEEYKSEKDNSDLIDYKFSCFNGIPQFVQIMKDRYLGKLRFNYYDMNFNPLYYSRKDHPANYDMIDEKPQTFNIMIEYAKILSKDFKYVRVDFYEINGEIYLGELTFTPGSGFFTYENEKDSITIGNLLKLNNE